MDNASKALLMSGSVLIGILVISLTMYVLATIRTYSEDSSSSTANAQTEAYNRFFVYSKVEDGKFIKGYDALNVIRKAKDINKNMDDNDYTPIDIYFGGDLRTSEEPEVLIPSGDYDSDYIYDYGLNSKGKINKIIINKN